MTPHELAHRVREKLNSELERIGAGPGYPRAPHGIAFKDYLAGAPASRFYRSIREDLAEPHWVKRAAAEAEALCRHELEILGYGTVRLGRDIDWHRDPVTGRVWERRFWADYRLVDDTEGRDPKIVHELNRHQHLPRLAKAYLWTRDERYAAEAVAQILSWIEQNPPGAGVNWHSSLEIGIRVISWLWTVFPLLSSHSLDSASAELIGDSLFAQLEHVHRHTSVYSSPNTHLIGEAAALFIAGIVFEHSAWRDHGASLLVRETGKQILDDGVYGELSSYYHCYALDFYLQALALAEQNRFEFPEQVRHKVCAMIEFLMHVTRPDGTIASLGDDDGGRALAIARRDYRSFTDALSTGAVLYGRGDFKRQSVEFAEETFWLLGEDARDRYHGLESELPAETERYFPDAGYRICRSGWGPRDSHLIFDCGGLGMLTGGHAHADALSIQLFSGGREVLIDPGTYVYNGAPEWRAYFRSTRAHNTVTIDGRDQAEQAGTFRWKTKLPCRANAIEAEHGAYSGVVHRRRADQDSPGRWRITDEFRGAGEHTFAFHYHFAAGVEFLVGIHASLPVSVELAADWRSRRYGEKEPTQTLRVTLTGAAPAKATTVLMPAEQAERLSERFLWLRVEGNALKAVRGEESLCAQSAEL